MADDKIFRKAVLDRLSSPEQLHLLMRVTDAKGWLALAAVALLLAAAVTWGIFGKVPNKVTASGVLIPAGGLADVVAMADGQLAALEVAPGDLVQKGQIVARIAQPELIAQIEALRKQARDLELGLEKSKEMGSADARMRSQASAQDRATLRANMDATVQRTRSCRSGWSRRRICWRKGLVTKDTVQGTKQQLRLAEATLKGAAGGHAAGGGEQLLRPARQRRGGARRQACASPTPSARSSCWRSKLAQSTAVVSPDTGRVVELRAAAGRRRAQRHADRQPRAHRRARARGAALRRLARGQAGAPGDARRGGAVGRAARAPRRRSSRRCARWRTFPRPAAA